MIQRCTTVNTCSCNAGYSGLVCDVALPTSSSVAVSSDRTDEGDEASGGGLDTKWLILIICVVALVVVVVSILGFILCR